MSTNGRNDRQVTGLLAALSATWQRLCAVTTIGELRTAAKELQCVAGTLVQQLPRPRSEQALPRPRSEQAARIVAEGSPSPTLAAVIRRAERLLAVLEAERTGGTLVEPSKDVIELLDNLSRYMVEEGFVVCEQQPDGVWWPSDVALSELYQDWVAELARRREEASREAATD